MIYKNITCYINPQGIDWAYKALTTCYHPESYGDTVARDKKLAKVIEVLGKGHLSIARYIDLFFYLEGIPHEVAVQIRTHKFLDCQVTSQRYTGAYLLEGTVEEVVAKYFYTRPAGTYQSRSGMVVIDEQDAQAARGMQAKSVECYRELVDSGIPYEVARNVLAQGLRQSMAIKVNVQGLMDFMTVRSTLDSQYEIREVVEGMYNAIPEPYKSDLFKPWRKKNWGKNKKTF